jgi:hypothetical protein
VANRAALKGPTSDAQGGNDETTRRARAEEIPIFPANAVMMGIRIPASLDRIRLRFEPFSSTRAASHTPRFQAKRADCGEKDQDKPAT